MKRIGRIKRLPGISVVVVALLATAAGTAIAESGPATTSVSVRKLSKQTRRALGRANKAITIARRTGKEIGPKGDTGAQGPRGNAGSQGPPGVSGLVVVEAATEEDAENTKEESVQCPPGKRVFGGGALVEGAFTFVAIDLTVPDGDSGWSAAAHEHTATAEGWQLIVYAICGNAT